jgi:hypothetical protein
MDHNSNKLIQFLLAASEIKEAFDQELYWKNPEYYRSLGPAYGQLALEVFKEVNPPLDWCYVLTRSKSVDATPDELAFWQDDQAILVLRESLENEGCFYASA